MHARDFREILSKRPFRPFRIHLTTGQVYEIPHPEFAVVGISMVWIYPPESTAQSSFIEEPHFVSLLHIVRGELLPPPEGSVDGNGST